MYVIKMENGRSLTTTICSTIYQGDRKLDTLVFVVPRTVEDVNIADCDVVLQYVMPNGEGRIEELEMYPIPYNQDYYQFKLSVSGRFTEQAGNIVLWLLVIDRHQGVLFRTGTAEVKISEHLDIDIEDSFPTGRLDDLEQKIMELERESVNNLRYDEENDTLQLVAGEKAIGDEIPYRFDEITPDETIRQDVREILADDAD